MNYDMNVNVAFELSNTNSNAKSSSYLKSDKVNVYEILLNSIYILTRNINKFINIRNVTENYIFHINSYPCYEYKYTIDYDDRPITISSYIMLHPLHNTNPKIVYGLSQLRVIEWGTSKLLYTDIFINDIYKNDMNFHHQISCLNDIMTYAQLSDVYIDYVNQYYNDIFKDIKIKSNYSGFCNICIDMHELNKSDVFIIVSLLGLICDRSKVLTESIIQDINTSYNISFNKLYENISNIYIDISIFIDDNWNPLDIIEEGIQINNLMFETNTSITDIARKYPRIYHKLYNMSKIAKQTIYNRTISCSTNRFHDKQTSYAIKSLIGTLEYYDDIIDKTRFNLDILLLDDNNIKLNFIDILSDLRNTRSHTDLLRLHKNVSLYSDKEIFRYSEISIDSSWINEMNNYIMKLRLEDIMNVYGYTYNGDVFVNNYIRKTFDVLKFYSYLDSLNTPNYLNYFPLFLPAYNILKSKYNIHNYNVILRIDVNIPDITASFKSIFESRKSLKDKYIVMINIAKYFDYDKFWKFVIESYCDNLQSIINNAPATTEHIVLYRGVKDDFYLQKFIQTNNRIYKSYGFMSTSSSINVAYESFSKKSNNKYDVGCCVMRLLIPKGSRCISISGISSYSDLEAEFLFGFENDLFIRDSKVIKLCDEKNTSLYRKMRVSTLLLINKSFDSVVGAT